MRLSRGMTLGVRVLVLDREERIALVRHTYVAGWHMPGGGVDPGESLHEAALREVREETGLKLEQELRLHGIYRHASVDPRDHVAQFVARERCAAPELVWPPRELKAAQWFTRDALPDDTTPATRRRLAEMFDGIPASEDW